jgi:aminoglycoside 6-adenylyltransferase
MNEKTVLKKFFEWAAAREDIRAVILTSTRTTPGAMLDFFSDYDIILATTHPELYRPDDWLADFGPLLVLYRDPVRLIHGEPAFARITQYANGLKIDFTIWTDELLRRVVAQAVEKGGLDPDLDLGYRVLLDKDGLTAGMPSPTYQAFIPQRPREGEYHTMVEEFFHEGTYVVKYIWRQDLMALKYIFDGAMKGECLRGMLEWYMQIGHGWQVRTGAYGRNLRHKLPPDIWVELEHTYCGAEAQDNWDAFYATIALFEKVARAVGADLGFEYPQDLHNRCLSYYRWIQALPLEAVEFGRV